MPNHSPDPRKARWDAPHSPRPLRVVGETGLLEALVGSAFAAGALEVGPGDDAAVWRVGPRAVAVTTDALVEGVDFIRATQTPYEVGLKAWGAAASDLAAMGFGVDLGVACLICRPDTEEAAVLAIQMGLVDGARRDGACLAGGDVSSIDGPLSVAVTAIGSGDPGSAVLLSGARPGEAVVVTGSLGEAGGALHLLQEGEDPPEAWRRRLAVPEPRLAEGRALRLAGTSAMTDLSDGLLLDAGRIAGASGCQLELWADRLPLGAGLRERLPGLALQLAASGGEDFELLACLAESRLPALATGWEGRGVTVIGVVREGSGVRLLEGRGGAELHGGAWGGFRHF